MIEIPAAIQHIGTGIFALALLHTFSCSSIQRYSHRVEISRRTAAFLHTLGEIELVFAFWSILLVVLWSIFFDLQSLSGYLGTVSFAEPIFVFCVICISASRPVLFLTSWLLKHLARLLPGAYGFRMYLSTMIAGPLLGSIITEPAAMTVTAIILKEKILRPAQSEFFLYATLGLLFVNVSIGGTLTHFAAPPVIMVAHPWDWGTPFMMAAFGWKAVLAVVISTMATAFCFRKSLAELDEIVRTEAEVNSNPPPWLSFLHLTILAALVIVNHYPWFCLGLLALFLVLVRATFHYQDRPRLKEGVLVGLFLAGLVTLGGLQSWWLSALFTDTSPILLFWGSTALTAITDNAAITYLGTLLPNLGPSAKYMLVAGAVTGGGLTIIANAPNPAGYSILKDRFSPAGLSTGKLLLAALPYTFIAAGCFLAFRF